MRAPMRLPLRSLLLVITVAFSSASPAAPREIPFRFEDGFISLDVQIGRSARPLNFLLDSGAGASVMAIRTAERLGLELGEPQSVQGVGADAMAYTLSGVTGSASGVPVGDISLALDLQMADAICGRRVDGLIGIDFFRDRVVQIDYARRKLRLLSAAPEGATERLPLQIRNGVLCAPVAVNGSRPRLARLDTGCNDALHWVVPRHRLAREERGVSIGFVTNPRNLIVATVSLGGTTLPQTTTALHGRPMFPGEAGLLGNGALSRFTPTIDWRNRELLLHDRAN